ncbi:MAG: response regulator transcription factor [Chloroflexi bacterium]|nr:response regulator transcription factor [Chloroflexota bacterium]
MTLRILLVDDHEIVRVGLKALLEAEPDLEVVAEADTAQAAVEQYLLHRPDIAVIDLRLPDDSGLEAARRIRERYPDARIILLTSFVNEAFIAQALRVGVQAYVLKEVAGDELIKAIREVGQGRVLFDINAAGSLLAHADTQSGTQHTPFEGLSPREMEVLALVAQGLSNREIGRRLRLSEGTVRNYVSAIIEKLNLRNRVELATYAVKHRIQDWVPYLGNE